MLVSSAAMLPETSMVCKGILQPASDTGQGWPQATAKRLP